MQAEALVLRTICGIVINQYGADDTFPDGPAWPGPLDNNWSICFLMCGIEISSEPRTWSRSLTAHYQVPMSCQDVFLLQSYKQIFSTSETAPWLPEPLPLFFGPHPIFRVSVAGRVAKKDPKNSIVILHLDDGSSSRNLSVPCSIAQLQDPEYILEGSLVVVEGQIRDHNLYGRQLFPDRIAHYRRNRVNIELAYQYEALEVRRRLLERKLIWPFVTADNGGKFTIYEVLREKFGLPPVEDLKGVADVVIRCT